MDTESLANMLGNLTTSLGQVMNQQQQQNNAILQQSACSN